MPHAIADTQLTTPSITFSLKVPSFKFTFPTAKKNVQQLNAPLMVDSYGIGQTFPPNTLNFSVPEFLPRCGMVMDPLERYEVEMERIERKRLLEAESVQALIRQEREKWETREAFKQLKHQEKEAHRGHRRSSSASEFVKKFIHRRADSGVAFTEVEKALQVEESAGVEKVGVMETGDSEELEGGPRMLKERVRLVKKVLKFLGW